MKNSITSILFTVVLLTMITSCGEKKPNSSIPEATAEVTPLVVPDFNSDSAYHFVGRQVEFGPRVPNSEAHRKCAAWLASMLKSYQCEVIVQKAKVRAFDNTTLNIQNIIGSINPESSDRILLCAHWDSRPFSDADPDKSNFDKPLPAANDGASGVGVLLEVARQFSLKNPGIGVDIIFFDAEDYGQPTSTGASNEESWCLGSQYWAKNPHKLNYKARFGILLDMVGAGGATFLKEHYSTVYAPDVMTLVWSTASQLGFSGYFINEEGGGVTDDHLFINRILKIPTIDIIHLDQSGQHSFFEHWHTQKDDMSNIDPKTLEAVGKTVLAVIYGLQTT